MSEWNNWKVYDLANIYGEQTFGASNYFAITDLTISYSLNCLQYQGIAFDPFFAFMTHHGDVEGSSQRLVWEGYIIAITCSLIAASCCPHAAPTRHCCPDPPRPADRLSTNLGKLNDWTT